MFQLNHSQCMMTHMMVGFLVSVVGVGGRYVLGRSDMSHTVDTGFVGHHWSRGRVLIWRRRSAGHCST